MVKNLKNKKKKKGFTLIELIIVIAIIAILAAVAIPKFGEVRKNANVKADVANAKAIANATTTLIADNKLTLPTNTSSHVLGSTVDTNADLIEGYLQNVPTPKSQTGDFTVTIDSKGGVVVLAGGKTFFPAAATDVN
ncbi:prepilin-type N-terminal cleavage/methylation domain-containing protein [Clostridium tertium]|jgi:type IV pilus assembly protein PilA|uniref:prepilin-type N-terminal cleavage/methylation domain-containing protein n=1 Tax=Clostridium tertium TaxID=1559 RepID=UPI000DCFFC4E|nr:prepilin-type N-terminal cleavage/methylation domain-containing protein [Clostridium tertium]